VEELDGLLPIAPGVLEEEDIEDALRLHPPMAAPPSGEVVHTMEQMWGRIVTK
jgi:hypothetical protein